MNTLKTTLLMALLTGLMVAVGGATGGRSGASMMLLISLGMNVFSYWFSDSIVLKSCGAQEVSEAEAPELYRLVQSLAENAGLPMPKVCIINSDVPNAFATGRSPSHAAVAVTTGIMRVLQYDELGGVLGHELSHIKHRDTLTSTIAAAIAGTISWIAQMTAFFGPGHSSDDDNGSTLGTLFTVLIAPFAAFLIQMAISRSREYDADKSGGEICGNPLALASALEKIEYCAKNMSPMPQASQATSSLFIVNPLTNSKQLFANLFSTHPPTEERIARLRAQAAGR